MAPANIGAIVESAPTDRNRFVPNTANASDTGKGVQSRLRGHSREPRRRDLLGNRDSSQHRPATRSFGTHASRMPRATMPRSRQAADEYAGRVRVDLDAISTRIRKTSSAAFCEVRGAS